MIILDQNKIAHLLDWASLIHSLETIFKEGCSVPVRHHHTISLENQQDATMLLMPAWISGEYAGVKIVNVFPDNTLKGLPTIIGNYLLMNGATGETIAIMDGAELTARRTAAASALASKFLSRKNSSKLFIAGSGRIAHYLGLAHKAVRPGLQEIKIWSRTQENAEAAVKYYLQKGFNATVARSLEEGTKWADIISCATLSTSPLIKNEWVQPGTHIDLVGAFKPEMRESDTELISKADVFVDTRQGTLSEAGDLLIPIQEDKFSAEDILGELCELVHEENIALCRQNNQQITLFKSVGAAQEDLAAAIACYEKSLS